MTNIINYFSMKRILVLLNKDQKVFFSLLFLFMFFHINIRAQLTANFITDKTEGCTPMAVQFTNLSTSGDTISYFWNFGDGGTSTLKNPSHTYDNNHSGFFTVQLTVSDTKNGSSVFATRDINVIYQPSANISIIETPACINEKIEFHHAFYLISPDSVRWNFGDGTTSNNFSQNPMTHIYTSNGDYTVTYITYNDEICSDTSENVVTISGPATDFTMSANEACLFEPITFSITNTTDITDIRWEFGDLTTADDLETVVHSYTNYGYPIIPKLIVTGLGRTCTLEDTIRIFQVEADFGYTEATRFCDARYIYFRNLSNGNDLNNWNFGDDSTSTQFSPRHVYQTGEYYVELIVSNTFGCSDTLVDAITIHNNPDIQLGEGWFVCEGGFDTLMASGGNIISWDNASTLDDPNSYTPIATPLFTTIYQATVTDTATDCTSTGFIRVVVQENPNWDVIIEAPRDTLIIGDRDTIGVDLGGNYLFTWASEDSIVSFTNNMIVVQPVVTKDNFVDYILTVSDTNNCFPHQETLQLYVREEYIMGLPAAFTPNNDNLNDEISLSGWGIKTLVEFKIYNRWGTEVFSTNDINTGWDGSYKNKPQPIDSYTYYVKAIMWDDREAEKKGSFSLIR